MRALSSVGISAYSWLNAASRGVVLPDALNSAPDDGPPWSVSGLRAAPPELHAETHVGRVSPAPPPLPREMLGHSSRAAELLMAALSPLTGEVQRAVARYGKHRIAVVLGSSTGGIDATERALEYERRTGKMPDDFVFEEAHVYEALVQVALVALGIEGFGYVVSTACSSAAKAIASAQRLIESGQADAVVTGGVDALCGLTVEGFSGLGILAKDACRPFDGARQGLSIGEGAALLLLDRASELAYRVLGAGESGDAHHPTAPHPEGLGARLSIERALRTSGLTKTDVDYVNAHGTGTPQNDAIEALALEAELGPRVRFSSTKDRTGHQLGTAGATEAIFAVEALRRNRIPPNRTPDVEDMALRVQPVTRPNERLSERPGGEGSVLSNSFAFGGSNVCLALGRRPAGRAPSPEGRSAPDAGSADESGVLAIREVAAWGVGYPNLGALLGDEPRPEFATPSAQWLPARARGRSSVLTRLYAELYGQLLGPVGFERFDPSRMPLVTASAYGEMAATVFLLDQLGRGEPLSPAKFQSSVHNTAQGLLGIVTGSREFSTSLAAGEASLGMALVEATGYLSLHGGEMVVLVADEEGPARLLRRAPAPALGVGLHLAWLSAQSADDLPLPILGAVRRTSEPEPEPTPSRRLAVFDGAPAAPGITLLERLAAGRDGVVPLGGGFSVELSRSRFFRLGALGCGPELVPE